ncbi:hypothetical protein IEO21_04612 [Rhodonia placenta]|uniref:Protein N-terminal glutamine amidohydrolase n=1 Tax=Rhodonia placenta TaxID=104341 RepID=A0A8H7P3I8_9APHY|nr:hypothetical protein IEO21_04612 [Postia placenta]
MQCSSRSPPPLPADSVYTSCYCEENVYLLAQALSSQAATDENGPWDLFVVFISNNGKTVALWNQKAHKDFIIWDYHVILALRPTTASRRSGTSEDTITDASEAWVYDFDTRLPVPCRWQGTLRAYSLNDYFLISFLFLTLFRVIHAAAYLDHFASDRSHMVSLEDPSDPVSPYSPYRAPPPTSSALCGPKAKELGINNNLMDSYVSMTLPSRGHATPERADGIHGAGAELTYGQVMDVAGFVRWISGEKA